MLLEKTNLEQMSPNSMPFCVQEANHISEQVQKQYLIEYIFLLNYSVT